MKYPFRLVVSLLALAVMAGVVSAQTTEPPPASIRRPYRGLFAPPADPTSTRQSLEATLSLFGAYDDDVYANNGEGTLGPEYQQSGWYTGATAGLGYANPGERASVVAGAEVGVNHYAEQDDTVHAYRTSADLSVAVARRTRLNLGGSFAYAPAYRLGLFLSPTSLTGSLDPFATVLPDLNIYRLHAYRSAGQTSIWHGLGRRGSLDGWYSASLTQYDDSRFDYRAWAAGGHYRYQLSRHASARIGYSYWIARYLEQSGVRPQRLHNVDAGMDYGRALSFSRRTSLNFSTGSALLVRDDLTLGTMNRDLSFHFIGNANLNHEMGRTWTSYAGYRRSVNFHEGFDEPFLSDAVNVGLTGLLSRRLRFSSGADYAFGSIGVGTGNHYDTLSANAGLEFAISRSLALFGRYVYYRYEFDRNVALDPRFARALDRQGVRVGLTAWLPIVR